MIAKINIGIVINIFSNIFFGSLIFINDEMHITATTKNFTLKYWKAIGRKLSLAKSKTNSEENISIVS